MKWLRHYSENAVCKHVKMVCQIAFPIPNSKLWLSLADVINSMQNTESGFNADREKRVQITQIIAHRYSSLDLAAFFFFLWLPTSNWRMVWSVCFYASFSFNCCCLHLRHFRSGYQLECVLVSFCVCVSACMHTFCPSIEPVCEHHSSRKQVCYFGRSERFQWQTVVWGWNGYFLEVHTQN